MATVIDKPRFYKPAHPARTKPPPADPLLEPSATAARLGLLASSAVSKDASALQSHAQAGIELQAAAERDPAEKARQQAEQIAWLDTARSALQKSLPLLGIRVSARECSALAKHDAVHSFVFRSRRAKHICADPIGDPTKRVLQLGVEREEELPETALEAMRAVGGELISHPVEFGYDYWTVDQVLRAILPHALEEGAPSAFSMVGHIAHINLREEYLAYRYLIGQVILEKTPRVRTVVNKLDTIDTAFRVFAMELLAGVPEYEAEVSESNCIFQLDFRTVYWNSRLHTEHARLIQQFHPFQVVADVMAGVGPFAVPAAKKGAWVLANDLNPNCYESLLRNRERNHVDTHLQATCQDGRAMVCTSVLTAWNAVYPGVALHDELKSARQRRKEKGAPQKTAPKVQRRPRRLVDHFVMNLPATALEFLDAYRGIYTRLGDSVGHDALTAELHARLEDVAQGDLVEPLPMVHVHCFTKDVENAGQDICARASKVLGLNGAECLTPPLNDKPGTPDLSLHLVRSVAPSKDMYCLSFRLPRSVLFEKNA
ncbi:tRNA (guanine(37)-N(1))-methyltransferase [Malassezia vespertilionis]|uniref:tRNA (guanine(37)-N1)-methyltransferase n=1 Tax=Malassezia vespertilionis TaxID=2020962 RepID=A0A2N1J9W2_9BASI|nr:tRNA (guanine(37)-N(1))-methyltransferase [Malassezia vespertilionis]PKI83350.1 Trm5p [Malassezia vespertilionis]WFD07149.1 tRNA (guanine(37)-N(1))-methyltransferase [Malassezia vespertilionis]